MPMYIGGEYKLAWWNIFEGWLTVYLPHEIKWNANLMQQGNFIDVFLVPTWCNKVILLMYS